MGRKGTGPISLFTVGVFTLLIVLNAGFVVGYVVMTHEEDDDDHDHEEEHTVRSSIELITAEGEIGIQGNITKIHLYVNLYGSEGVDMRDVVLHIACDPNGGPSIMEHFLLETWDDPEEFGFTVEEIQDPLGAWDPEGTPASFVLSQRAQLKLTIDLEEDLVELPPDSTVEITVDHTSTGHETYDYLRTPSAYPSMGSVMLED
jgi:hypothetical protein